MGYLHITNLYKDGTLLSLFRELYALEKVHGSSAHVGYRRGEPLRFFAGGCKHETFVAAFDQAKLAAAFEALGVEQCTVYGEVHGGKIQKMSETYGKETRFVAFDVKISDCWLAVPQAADVVASLGLEFVYFEKIPATVEAVDAARDRPSEQARRRGLGEKVTEGVILRPLMELTKNNGERLIAKHKRAEFAETATERPTLSEGELKVLEDAKAIAAEWVTEMRMTHVLDKGGWSKVEETGLVCRAMLADVQREGAGEIRWTQEAEHAVKKAAGAMFKKRATAVRS